MYTKEALESLVHRAWVNHFTHDSVAWRFASAALVHQLGLTLRPDHYVAKAWWDRYRYSDYAAIFPAKEDAITALQERYALSPAQVARLNRHGSIWLDPETNHGVARLMVYPCHCWFAGDQH